MRERGPQAGIPLGVPDEGREPSTDDNAVALRACRASPSSGEVCLEVCSRHCSLCLHLFFSITNFILYVWLSSNNISNFRLPIADLCFGLKVFGLRSLSLSINRKSAMLWGDLRTNRYFDCQKTKRAGFKPPREAAHSFNSRDFSLRFGSGRPLPRIIA